MTNQIPKSMLQDMFDNIGKKAKWDMSGNMLWGYFFTDSDKSVLELAAKKLVTEGYTFVDLFEAGDDEEPLDYYFLHVEKVETHSVDSLYKRNTELEAFAAKNGVDKYDGMDVGPVDFRPGANQPSLQS